MIHERITMLGTTGAGKTCFLVGMYADMSGGRRGFTFSTNPDADLDLSSKWGRLIEAGPDRWPAPTGRQLESYTFGFNYGFRRIMEFDWKRSQKYLIGAPEAVDPGQKRRSSYF